MKKVSAMIGCNLRLLIGIVVTFAAILISGCAADSLNYTDEASVFFECIPSEDVVIRQVHAYEDGDELVIYGKVKRTIYNCCNTTKGQVDIHLVGPDGSVLDTFSVLYSPRNIPKAGSRSSRFMARLPYIIPYGFFLRMTYSDNLKVVDSTSHRLTIAAR